MAKSFNLLMILMLCNCTAHKSRYMVGNSYNCVVEIDEFVNVFLEAKCKGDTAFLSLLFEQEVMHSYLTVPAPEIFEKLPEACRLKVTSIYRFGESNVYYVHLDLEGSVNSKYFFSFLIKNGRIYLETPLRKEPLSM